MPTKTIPAIVFLFALTASSTFAQNLTEAEFRRLHNALRPPKGEPYLSIPWKTSLLDAQKTAAAQRKPIFIWAMDGHPLGCT